METGYRARRAERPHCRATSSAASRAATTASSCSAPICTRRSRPIRYFAFSTVATDSGTLSFTWEGDNGFAQTETRADHRHMRPRGCCSGRRRRGVACARCGRTTRRRAPLRLRHHEPARPGDAARRHAEPGHAVGGSDGEALWNARPGRATVRARAATAMPRTAMRGVAARYPAFDADRAACRSTSRQRINLCRRATSRAAAAAPRARDARPRGVRRARSRAACRSRRPTTRASSAVRERGRALCEQRMGQLNLSCAQCHDEQRRPARSAAASIPAGASDRLPDLSARMAGHGLAAAAAARLHERRARRAVSVGATEMIELELYLAQRGAGLRDRDAGGPALTAIAVSTARNGPWARRK